MLLFHYFLGIIYMHKVPTVGTLLTEQQNPTVSTSFARGKHSECISQQAK